MATDSYVILRQVIVHDLQPDGTIKYTPKYGKPFTVPLNVEKTGKLRMFMFVPEFLGDFLGSWRPEGIPGVELTQRRRKDGREALGWAVIGREPDAIEKAYGQMVNAYMDSLAEIRIEPRIVIRSALGVHGNEGIKLDFYRYLHNTALDDSKTRQRFNISHYQWADDLKPKIKTSHYLRSDDKSLPYNEDLWNRLTELKEQLREAAVRLDRMISDGTLGDRLLSGKGPLLLLGGK